MYCRGAKYVNEQSLKKTMFIGWWSEIAGGVNEELRCHCTASDVAKARTEALLPIMVVMGRLMLPQRIVAPSEITMCSLL